MNFKRKIMKTHILIKNSLLFLLILLIGGCAKPFIGDIKKSAFPETMSTYKTTRNVQVQIDSIIDKRPLYELRGKTFEGIYYIIPLVILDFWSSANSTYTPSKRYDETLLPSMNDLMKNILTKSNISSNNNASKQYILKTELLHYYAFHFEKSNTSVIYFLVYYWAKSKAYYYFPTGFASLKLTLIDKSTMNPVSTRYISNGFLFNEASEGLSTEQTAEGGLTQNKDEQCVIVATTALKGLMSRIPDAIDEMLSEQDNLSLNSSINTFKLIRLTNDYNFQEEVLVEYETGNILKSEIIKRKSPIISKPNEWIVAPVNDEGHYLSSTQYNKMISMLQQKYDVKFESNLSAANFYGSK